MDLDENPTKEHVRVYEVLEGRSSDQDKQEVIVVEKVLENIEVFASNLSAVDLVEDLEEYESVVDLGQLLLLVG